GERRRLRVGDPLDAAVSTARRLRDCFSKVFLPAAFVWARPKQTTISKARPDPNRARVDTSAAPRGVRQAGLFVDSACWCQSLSQNKECWQRTRKAARIEVNQIVAVLSSFGAL